MIKSSIISVSFKKGLLKLIIQNNLRTFKKSKTKSTKLIKSDNLDIFQIKVSLHLKIYIKYKIYFTFLKP